VADVSVNGRWLLGNWVETYLQLDPRDLAEYDRLREIASNLEVRAMELTWAEQMELKGVEKGIEKGIEALHRVVLRLLNQRFGAIPETVQRKVEAIDSMDSLSNLATKVFEVESIDDMGL
jgi:predicted transposase YdaD